MLKESNTGIWVTNVQLGTISAIFGVIMCFFDEGVAKNGVLYGWNYSVWLLSITQAIGGVLTAAVFFFSNSVAKAYSGSISLILIRYLLFYWED
jgi:hypothetical protein